MSSGLHSLYAFVYHKADAVVRLSSKRIIITTEKDAARLVGLDGLSDDVRNHIYALPIKTTFLLEQQEQFDEFILSYVLKNSKDSILHKSDTYSISR